MASSSCCGRLVDLHPNRNLTGTDSFTYTITTTDAGAPRTSTATVTITVAPAPPTLPETGTNVLPIGLAGGALLLVGCALVVSSRRRRDEVG